MREKTHGRKNRDNLMVTHVCCHFARERPSEHVALAVGGGDVVLRLLQDAHREAAAVDVHVRDVDVVGALGGLGEMLSGEPAFEVEDDGRARREQQHGELVHVAVLDVAVDAVVDGGHHAVGADLDEQAATEGVDGPAVTAELRALGVEEGDGLAVDLVVDAVELAGCHDGTFSSALAGMPLAERACVFCPHKMR
jgi:hypothetical protein